MVKILMKHSDSVLAATKAEKTASTPFISVPKSFLLCIRFLLLDFSKVIFSVITILDKSYIYS